MSLIFLSLLIQHVSLCISINFNNKVDTNIYIYKCNCIFKILYVPSKKYWKKACQILTMIISGRWNLDYILLPLLSFLTEIIGIFKNIYKNRYCFFKQKKTYINSN